MSAEPAAVLFVCLGNICRSPLAEAAFRCAAASAGLEVHADSAGTGNWHSGNPPDPRARAIARNRGVSIDHYRARQIVREDFRRFTHIFALDHANLKDIRRIAPANAGARVSLLLDMVPGRTGEAVADPYYGDAADFEETWAQVSEAAQYLVWHLQSKG